MSQAVKIGIIKSNNEIIISITNTGVSRLQLHYTTQSFSLRVAPFKSIVLELESEEIISNVIQIGAFNHGPIRN